MAVYRLKHSFTAGELSPLMFDRTDFDRYKNGCKILKNAVCATQGPAVRRPGFKFIYSLNLLGIDVSDPLVRTIPFIFNENQAYVMIFYMHTDGFVRMVLGTGEGLVVDAYDAIVSLTFPADWDIENFDWAQSADEMYIAQSGLQPYVIERLSHTSWQLVAKTFTDQPSEWSDTNGWPERVTFHQQRLVFAANLTNRQTVWMSVAGDFDNFGVFEAGQTGDADAITFTLDSGTQNKIQWITSGKSLHIGTLGNEWTVVGGTQTSLTPTNILAQRQTSNGSEPNKPLLVGLTTLFVERHGRTVNEFVYDYTYDSYKTSDMAVLSPHITEQYSITDWAYQQTPYGIIWCIREDGNLLGITYQRQHKVVGWHEHDTLGAFKSVSVIPGDTREDDVWAIVKRVIDGSDVFYVEKMEDWFKDEEAEWGRFLDSHAVYLGTPVDSITSGLDHLEGEEVDVLADGTVHPAVIVTDGEITLNDTYAHIVVGLPFVTEVRPVLSDVAGELGTSLGRMQRISRVRVDLFRSLGMILGREDSEDGEFEEEIPFRVPSNNMGEQVPLFTGWKRLDFMEGFDLSSEYFIRQRQPLPLTVRAVVDDVEVTE